MEIKTSNIKSYFLTVPKLPKKWKEDSSELLLWAEFINAERKEDFDMLAEKNPSIASAYQRLQTISRDEQKRIEYEAREKAIRDQSQMMFEAEQRGMKQGSIRIAKKMRREGMDTDLIIRLTGLSRDEIPD